MAIHVQRGTIELSDGVTSETVTLSTAVPQDHAFVMASQSADQGDGRNRARVWLLNASGDNWTQIRVERGSYTDDSVFVEWQVIYCDDEEFSVQSGEVAVSSTATKNQSISAVTLSKTFVAVTETGSYYDAPYSHRRALLTSTTNLALVAAGSYSGTYRYYVVEWEDATVQSVSISNTSQTNTASISEVDLSHAFVVYSFYTTATRRGARIFPRVRLSSTTQLEMKRGVSNSASYGGIYVVEHEDFTVQSGLGDTSDYTVTATLSACDLAESFTTTASSGNGYTTCGGSYTVQRGLNRHKLYMDGDDVKLDATRERDDDDLYVSWFVTSVVSPVVEPEAGTTAATNVTTDAGRINGKVVDDGGEGCDARFRWRETGAATWTETSWQGSESLVTDDTFYHDLSGLDANTEYEYQAQARNSAGDGDWSDSETFTTYNSLLKNDALSFSEQSQAPTVSLQGTDSFKTSDSKDLKALLGASQEITFEDFGTVLAAFSASDLLFLTDILAEIDYDFDKFSFETFSLSSASTLKAALQDSQSFTFTDLGNLFAEFLSQDDITFSEQVSLELVYILSQGAFTLNEVLSKREVSLVETFKFIDSLLNKGALSSDIIALKEDATLIASQESFDILQFLDLLYHRRRGRYPFYLYLVLKHLGSLHLRPQMPKLNVSLTQTATLTIIQDMTAYTRGEDIYMIVEYRDRDKVRVDPAVLNVTLYDPMQNKILDASSILSNTISTGIFYFIYTPASDAIMGSKERPWTIVVESEDGGDIRKETANFYLV